jgi:DNA-binding CsgD family transcriptional regulator
MKIEKVSRYVPVVTGLKSEGVAAGSTQRHMLLSIPRLKWLEGEGTDFYHKYKSPEAVPLIENPSHSAHWVKEVQTLPITDRELLVEKLVNDGKTRKQVAEAVGVEPGSVANILNRVRVKRAYQALSHDASLEPDGDE